jgi:hypothetical protein
LGGGPVTEFVAYRVACPKCGAARGAPCTRHTRDERTSEPIRCPHRERCVAHRPPRSRGPLHDRLTVLRQQTTLALREMERTIAGWTTSRSRVNQ